MQSVSADRQHSIQPRGLHAAASSAPHAWCSGPHVIHAMALQPQAVNMMHGDAPDLVKGKDTPEERAKMPRAKKAPLLACRAPNSPIVPD